MQSEPNEPRLRVVIADDHALLLQGLVNMLESHGFEVVAQAGDADDLIRKVGAHRPDAAVIDIRMPPTNTDDGLRAAVTIRQTHPDVGVLLLSQYVEAAYALELIGDDARGVGYLLKDRIADFDEFAGALRRVAGGGSVLDPEVVRGMLGRPREESKLAELTAREREVLGLLAEGYSNQGVAQRIVVSERAVEKHITSILSKLGLRAEPQAHRRVMAVLAYLEDARTTATRLGRNRLEARPHGGRRAVEDRLVAHELVVVVRGAAERVELERELLGIDRRVEVAGLLRLADLARQERQELAHVLGDRRAHGAVRPAVELGLDGVEEAAAAEHLRAEVLQPVDQERLQPRAAAREAARGPDHVVDEPAAGGVDRRQLQLLLGAEVREQAALAHAQLGREPADGEALEPFDGGDVGRRLQDRLARGVAAPAAPVGLVGNGGRGAGERFEVFR